MPKWAVALLVIGPILAIGVAAIFIFHSGSSPADPTLPPAVAPIPIQAATPPQPPKLPALTPIVVAASQSPPPAPIAFRPIAAMPAPESQLPSIDSFDAFGKRLAAGIQNKMQDMAKDAIGDGGSTTTHSVFVDFVDADYKHSDSLVNPVIGVITMRHSMMVEDKSASGDLVFSETIEKKITLNFARRSGRWIPIKAVETLTKDENYPAPSPDIQSQMSPIGSENDIANDWIAAVSNPLQ